LKISAIIPVKNGAQTLPACLEALRTQTINNIEIIILDSNSKDNSKEIALSYKAKVIDVSEVEFNHGLTRNLGADVASGDFLFFSVQDAWLGDNNMFEKMVKHFDDEKVMGVVGHQAIPWGHDDKNPAYWFKRFTEPQVQERYFPQNSFATLSQNEQFSLSGWDDVVAMYRRTALMNIPFKKTNFSEDWLWASDALKHGYKLISDPSVVVYHYHHLSFSYRFKTQFIVNYHFYKYFNQLPKVAYSPMKFVRASYTIIKRKSIPAIKKPYWIVHNLGINMADFFSTIIFRLLFFVNGDSLLERGYQFFCKKIPQGQIKNKFAN
jgi:rhamnosyltransferase